jgi:hypothetical protein
MNLTFAVSLQYLNGTVLYRRAILDGITIRNSGFFYQAELLIKTIRKNFRFVEVPYLQQRRIDGRPKSITLKSLLPVLRGYFSLINELCFLQKDHDIIAARKKQDEISPSTGNPL